MLNLSRTTIDALVAASELELMRHRSFGASSRRLGRGVRRAPAPSGRAHAAAFASGDCLDQAMDDGLFRYDVRWRPSSAEGGRCRTFPTLEAARGFRAQIDAEMARGLVFDPRAGRVLFRHFAELGLLGARRRRGTHPAPVQDRTWDRTGDPGSSPSSHGPAQTISDRRPSDAHARTRRRNDIRR
jgi:hypothetical protein